MPKLVKEVCQKCVQKKWGEWTESDEDLWNNSGCVWCWHSVYVLGRKKTGNWETIDHVPSECPYHFEHIVLGGEYEDA